MATGGCGVNHAPPVVGLGLQIGALADEPFRDSGFSQAQREVQRGVADLIRCIDVDTRSQLCLGVGEVTAQDGQVDFFNAVIALQVGGIIPGQLFGLLSFSKGILCCIDLFRQCPGRWYVFLLLLFGK